MSKIYEIIKNRITERLEEALKNGESFSWVKPWKGAVNRPENYISRKAYRGINALLVPAGEYITYKQVQDLKTKDEKINIKKGAKQETIYFFKLMEKKKEENTEEETDKKEQIPFIRFYHVFNINDVEGLETHYPVEEITHNETETTKRADTIIEDYLKRENITLNIVKNGNSAYYTPALNQITIPDKSQYKNISEYYSTLIHECIHSTGKTLKRDLTGGFGSNRYSLEELIAEIGSQMVLNSIGLENTEGFNNSVAYIQGWLNTINKENLGFIVKAANKAQKAADLLLNIKTEEAAA